MARIVDFSVDGVDPDHMGWGPVPATEKVMAKTGLELSEMGLIELHEAFAAQYLACEMGLALKEKRDIVNVSGSGKPLGTQSDCERSEDRAILLKLLNKLELLIF